MSARGLVGGGFEMGIAAYFRALARLSTSSSPTARAAPSPHRPQAELTHHLGYEKGDPAGRGSDDHRNGSYPKTVLTEDGAVELDVPRDRNGTFDPQIVPKGETRLDGFDDKIISMYGRLKILLSKPY